VGDAAIAQDAIGWLIGSGTKETPTGAKPGLPTEAVKKVSPSTAGPRWCRAGAPAHFGPLVMMIGPLPVGAPPWAQDGASAVVFPADGARRTLAVSIVW